MPNSFDLLNKVRIANPSANVDYYYGTYASVEEACLAVPMEVRMLGKTVGIVDGGSVVEYWWKSGLTDADLEEKASGGGGGADTKYVVIGEKNLGDGGITTTKTVGGVDEGVFLGKNTYVNKILRDILAPALNPALTNPSAELTASLDTRLFEVGSQSQVTFTITFDRGSIDPQYTSGSPYRSGVATGYKLNGGDSQISNSFLETLTMPQEGQISYVGNVTYEAGVQPKNNEGSNYDSALPAGNVDSNSIDFEFVYPMYANVVSIDNVIKLPLVSKGAKFIEIEFPPQDETHRYTFEIKSDWEVVGIYLYNTISEGYDVRKNKLDEFDVENISKGGVFYKRYKKKGSDKVGKNTFKIVWS